MPTADSLAPPAPGLRVRKRERTRRSITDAAFALFAERGFDAVRLTEIAAAADVAPATVFTHFGSKEEIFFNRRAEFDEHLPEAVADAANGAELVSGLREFYGSSVRLALADEWIGPARTFARILLASPALRRSYLSLVRERQDLLIAALYDRAPGGADTAELALFAGFVAAVAGTAFESLHAGLASDEPAERIRQSVDEALDRGFARLARAYPGDTVLDRR
ncbi:TetR/AcrR family transcriptional regulator [Kitasatospora sp. NPDC056138]|uniref:TetR/AcrR family transcriptional regulator n=1 Tax=Kitasatospora sp. NPDC056138 TaxID=3345724 RepID=UPI0035DB1202